MNMIDEMTLEIEQPQRSGLATAALICSLIICCPLTTIVGPILGIISLFSLRDKPQVAGRGFAWTAIIIGIISSIIWVFIGIFLGKMAVQFIEKTAEVTTATIQAGYDSDFEVFRNGLARNAIQVTDEEIISFIDEIKLRYGKFDSAMMNLEGSPSESFDSKTNESLIPVRLIFETTAVYADIMLEVVPESQFDITLHIVCIRIYDSKDGDIVFPTGSVCDASIIESDEEP